VSDDAMHQPTWPLLLKIEHGKIAGFWVITQKQLIISEILHVVKMISTSKIYLPCNFEVNLNTHLGVIALFSSNF
jgi:hypothetical protein